MPMDTSNVICESSSMRAMASHILLALNDVLEKFLLELKTELLSWVTGVK
jgi:hypothetical protein